MSDLRLYFCSHEAAKCSVRRWHYSRSLPKSKVVRIGVWEGGRFVGVVLFSVGANRHLGKPYDLGPFEVCELTRVALAPGREHPTSRVIAVSLKLLKRQSPGLRLVISFADLGQGHLGVLYRAGNWFYLGTTSQSYFKIHGRVIHPRSVYDKYGRGGQRISWLRANVDPKAERVAMPAKLRYGFPLDRQMRQQLQIMAFPYPKSANEVIPGDTLGDQPREGGSSPTRSLHPSPKVTADGEDEDDQAA